MISRAFTLIEAIICVTVLAIAVPPALETLDSVASDRADAVNTIRAAMFVELILESCLADCSSRDATLGFEALADEAAYIAVLRSRIDSIAAPYLQVGMDYRVTVGERVDRTGIVNPDASKNIYRVLTVTVTYPSSSGNSFELPVAILLGQIS
ncbi:MAG: hypothetical protein D6692_05090 [Planctomycetota bacterium]|nr:MAG: hypothetical protein D6692_05090 [Planctomycetota bacterium]